MGNTNTIEREQASTGELVTTPPTALPKRSRRAPKSDENATLMFERLAKDPSVDVEKLERLIAMQERVMRHQAKAAFDAAFSEMQGEIPVITERGQILVKGELRSKYATNEDIQETVKPILQRHGFSIRFRHEQEGNRLKIIGILSHCSGHSEQDEFIAAADDSGSKNSIQALGSTRSYGQRYTTMALLNIATRGADDDGQSADPAASAKADSTPPPSGYDDWLLDMEASADEGWPKLSKAFSDSKAEYRKRITTTDKAKWAALRAKAEKAVAS